MSLKTPAERAVYVVLHTHDVHDVTEQAAVALEAGAGGVFLIDHGRDEHRLLDACVAVRREHATAFVGANLIGRSPRAALLEVLRRGADLDALWTDNAQVNPDGDLRAAVDFLDLRERVAWSGTHFGGVAMKHQPAVPTEHLSRLGSLAAAVVDVPTTSGPATGQAISRERLSRLRAGLGDHPLAAASGMSVANVDDLGPLLTHALVSSSVVDESGRIDATLLTGLVARFHAVVPAHRARSARPT